MYEAIDVIIQTTANQAGWMTYEKFPPINRKIDLSDELWIGPLPIGESKMVFDACDPPGLNFNPVRQFGARYCHGRTIMSEFVPDIRWDADQLLRKSFFSSISLFYWRSIALLSKNRAEKKAK